MRNKVAYLLRPRWISLKRAAFSKADPAQRNKVILFGLLGLGFWLGIFALVFKVLTYFNSVGEEDFGRLLATKLLAMVFPTFFALVMFSGVVTTLSKLYLSRDLYLVHSFPASHDKIFLARWIESVADSSWMILVYALPVFAAYGVVYHMGPLYYLNIAFVMTPFCVTACAVSALVVLLAAVVLPANRFRGILVFFGIGIFLLIYLGLRLVRPERLVDPEISASLVTYMAAMKTPSSAWLPPSWAYESMRAALEGRLSSVVFHNALAFSFAALCTFIVVAVASAVYFPGMSRAQHSRVRNPGPLNPERWRKRRLAFFSGISRAFFVKEWKTFFRDTTQWPQLFLMAALIGIYLYNFKVLPLEKAPIKTVYLQNILAFLNMGLATFVLTALAARFVYPAVSMEREAFWIVKAAPVKMGRVLWIKFFIYYPPMLILSEVLVVSTNMLLKVTPFMMIVSTATVFFMVPGIIALGIGLGAAYPDFTAENPVQSVTGFGGLLFMILSAAFIGAVIVIEAGPVYLVARAGFKGMAVTSAEWLWLWGSFIAAAVLCVIVTVWPMRFGARRLSPLP
ncbi:MAG: hypothetical protein HZB23_16785 [Deltaproteobacteria bacterium]|nr:hypothetical protein [Deltaproteobacteria bacterium]